LYFSFLSAGSINLEGLGDIKWDELMSLPKHYWEDDIRENKSFLKLQVGEDLPKVISDELEAQEKRIEEELFA
jgi:phosphoenolpyruvate carboxykinase (GTP)